MSNRDAVRQWLDEKQGERVSVWVETGQGRPVAAFRGVLKGPVPELGPDRHVLDDGQPVGSFDETSVFVPETVLAYEVRASGSLMMFRSDEQVQTRLQVE